MKSLHPPSPSLPFGGLALVVYVDDLILSGPSQWHEPFWEALGEKVLIDDIGPLGRFLGRHHSLSKLITQSSLALTCAGIR